MPQITKVPFDSRSYSGGPYQVSTGTPTPHPNAGATVLFGGNFRANTNISQALSLSTIGYHQGYGSVIPATVSQQAYVIKGQPNSFNKLIAGQYVINGFSSKLAGVANPAVQSPGSFGARVTNHYSLSYFRTTRINLGGGWSYINGFPLNAVDAIDLGVGPGEVFPTYSIPGRITYLQGAKTAITVSYKAKTD